MRAAAALGDRAGFYDRGSMDPVLRTLLLERLGASDLDDEAKRVIEVAADSAAPAPTTNTSPPVWLKEVTVEGFRGIGRPATLKLDPSPGLTVVVGRNGSGKSSFAEGLELLMTGALKRWEKRPKAWSETWQCLHHTAPTTIAAQLQLEGGEVVTLDQQWPHGAPYGDASGRAQPAATLAQHGWDRDLPSFRPFLAYAELATMFDTLSSLYDALTPVLGLGDLDALAAQLAQTRLQLDGQRKAVTAERDQLLARLDPEDDRSALVGSAIGGRKPDLAQLEGLLEETPSYTEDLTLLRRLAALALPSDTDIRDAFQDLKGAERAHADASATDAARATNLAALLRQALAFKDPQRLTDDCPVCKTPDVLDEAWVAAAQEEAAQLEEEAQALTRANAQLAVARRRVESLLDGNALAAPHAARHLGLVDEELELARASEEELKASTAALRDLTQRAATELERKGAAWQELAGQLRGWLGRAKDVETAAATLKAIKDAEKWLKGATDELRRERFAPISQSAIANWQELRQGSSVDLHEITLKKVGKGGRADFDVRADDTEANALGVMSQGELLALSVSVFLPRAALEESPFRFAVIDDPVQAMDPAKVDGLAKVLHRAARTRQIIVFTHDDRLPEAIRRLRLDATMLHVDRRAQSSVDVQVSRSPVQRYLDGARGYAKPDRLPVEVQARVVPMFCRSAVEAAAANIVRRRAAQHGTDLTEADEQIAEARSLRETLALVLFGDAGRHGEVGAEIKRRYGDRPAALIAALNRGAHGNVLERETLAHLPDSTRSFIRDLETTAK
ncbi:AAA domain-containing protein [Solirubrobacter pauli]|uniref:AAA domain-containing protein n=2 Tax=Solirubrobacter pauli TaxID=166793 RepID=A0A660LJW2_9ACTN|nr:AAA domain-containing protein [Solirubrobacter pauli]